MLNNQCLIKFPKSLIANRIDFTCQEHYRNQYFWVYPSVGSCKGKCNKTSWSNIDCSCEQDCLQKGYCFDDFKKNCRELLIKKQCDLCKGTCSNGVCSICKENAKLINGSCRCNRMYRFDVENNICITKTNSFFKELYNTAKNDNLKLIKKTGHSKLDIDKIISRESKQILQKIVKNSKQDKNKNTIDETILENKYFNKAPLFKYKLLPSLNLDGNFAFNILHKNKQIELTSKSSSIIQSFNLINSTFTNIDSSNNFQRVSRTNNVNQDVNYESISISNIVISKQKSNRSSLDLRKNQLDFNNKVRIWHNIQFNRDELELIKTDLPSIELKK